MRTQNEKNRGGCLLKRLHRGAFTLIELLVVIAIILILSGISLKVMSIVGSKAGLAKTDLVLEQLKNALAGYYATYGSYPPATEVTARCPYNQPASLETNEFLSRGLLAYLISGADMDPSEATATTKAYLNSEATRWEHYLKGLYGTERYATNASQGMSMMDFTNVVIGIYDGWDRSIGYKPHLPECQGYTLWSEGPTDDTNDDIYVTFQ